MTKYFAHLFASSATALSDSNAPQSEMDREDMKHHIFMLITEGQLQLAPIDPHPQLILDIGTGTGRFSQRRALCVTIADW